MAELYIPLRERRRITIPQAVFRHLQWHTGDWLYLAAVDENRLLIERVVAEPPAPLPELPPFPGTRQP